MQVQSGRKAVSPTAQLLRSSRLFSIPEPLPRPRVGPPTKTSYTATLPYPIRQAITAPPSSVSRGDFGLKRNLPLRKLAKNKNPVVRIIDLDTIEHVTDYEFAAEHTQTLKKVQELNMVTSYYSGSRFATGPTNAIDAFDESVDNTYLAPGQDNLTTSRWKQGGGTLVNRTETQFEGLLRKQARTLWKQRRAQHLTEEGLNEAEHQAVEDADAVFSQQWASQREHIRKQFMDGLRFHILAEYQSYIRQQATDEGRDVDPEELKLNEQDYEERLRGLYDEFRSQAENFDTKLHKYISSFLDLPGNLLEADKSASSGRITNVFASPRSTHPSAGLSYLRSDAFVENHPTFGPLAKPHPVQGRVLQHSTTGTGRGAGHYSVYGVAGVVFRVDHTSSVTATNPVRSAFDFEEAGGSKIWVHPSRLSIDREGKIRLQADQASVEVAVAIKQGGLPPPQPLTQESIRINSSKRSENRTTMEARSDRDGYGDTLGLTAKKSVPADVAQTVSSMMQSMNNKP